MSIKALRFAATDLAQSRVPSFQGLLAPSSGGMNNNSSTHKRMQGTASMAPVVEGVVLFSQFEALFPSASDLSPSMSRTLSELEEWGDEDEDGMSIEEEKEAAEDPQGFSPRPAHPPSDEKKAPNRLGELSPKIRIEHDYESDEGPSVHSALKLHMPRVTLPRASCKDSMDQSKQRNKGALPRVPPLIDIIDPTNQRTNAILIFFCTLSLANLGAKIGSTIDIWLASIGVVTAATATSGPEAVNNTQSFLSRIFNVPTFGTLGTAFGASLGAVMGIKVADMVLEHIEKIRKNVGQVGGGDDDTMPVLKMNLIANGSIQYGSIRD